jgi:hypothetical protein
MKNGQLVMIILTLLVATVIAAQNSQMSTNINSSIRVNASNHRHIIVAPRKNVTTTPSRNLTIVTPNWITQPHLIIPNDITLPNRSMSNLTPPAKHTIPTKDFETLDKQRNAQVKKYILAIRQEYANFAGKSVAGISPKKVT